MKNYLWLVIACLALGAKAQGVQDMIKAERAFAACSRDENTRAAFLKFMDANGVVFNDGKAQNAIETWTKNRVSSAKLLWEPAFAGMAASGDVGFTTGPWQYKKTMADTAMAAGMFNSIWRKNAAGEWKNIVDMGYAFTVTKYNEPAIKISTAGKPLKADATINAEAIDQQLIDSYTKNGNKVFNDFLAADSWLNTNGRQPATTTTQHADAIAKIPADLVMKPLGGDLSAAKDLAYVYGSVNDKENYLRVWKHTNAGWKLALQVITW